MNRLTTDYLADPDRGIAVAATTRSGNERVFRAAMRHSRRVRWLRVGIPVALVAVLAAITFGSVLKSYGLLDKLPGSLGGLVISGTKITMAQPRLTGFTRDSRAYEIIARAASQDITKPDTMELNELRAKFAMQDKSALEMTATRGVYDSKTDILKLADNILLTSSNGYEGQLTEAMVDIKRGNVVSEKPVVVKMQDGVLNANRLEVVQSGQVIRFEGGVSMMLQMKNATAPAPKKAGAR